MVDRRTIDVPSPSAGWGPPWPSVAEIEAVLPHEKWTLVGGLMAQLHGITRQINTLRPTTDVDMVLHIETTRGVAAETARALESLGYELAPPIDDRSNTAHRFKRGRSVVDRVGEGDVVDVLIADHPAPRVIEKLRGRSMVSIEGGTQALRRAAAIVFNGYDSGESNIHVLKVMHTWMVDTESLIRSGESLRVEFKAKINDRELVKAVACLANGGGGVLLVGVDDHGVVLGSAPRHGATTVPDRVAAMIQNTTEPALPVMVRTDEVDGIPVLRIDVPAGDPGPVGTRDGTFTKRVIDTTGRPECVPMTAHEIVSMGMVMRGQDFAAAAAAGATLAHLDPGEFERFRWLCRAAGDNVDRLSDADILKALGLAPLGAPVSLGAVLLFGLPASVERWIPNAEFLFQDIRTTGQAANRRMVGPLLWLAEELRTLIDERNSVVELIVGLHRVEVPLIPSVTRREAVANALVHRDYAALGPGRVQITSSEFVVANPGGFPPGVTVANILEQSRPRSPSLASAFKRAGLVERRGKGVNDMFEQQLRAGRDAPDYGRSTADSVIVSVSLGTADLDLVRFLLTFENDTQQILGLDDLRVVHEIRASGSATGAELAEALSLLPATVRAITTRLAELGILEARGNGRSRKYHLTARFYDLAQDRNAYVRVKGADPLQQERMITDYLVAYGFITRGQAAQLCQISPAQARYLLKQMVDRGRLQLTGERRGARYRLADTE